jgi:two-component system, NtrC family, sensor kinase
VISDPRLEHARELLLELATPDTRARVEAVRADLAAIDSAARDCESRVQELVDALYALASLVFSVRPRLRDDGSPIDAAVGCVLMLGEELAAFAQSRVRIERELEERVEQRTQELIQASKMAAVGQLAAGIAHEINNPLAVILGFSEGIERRLATSAAQLKLPIASIVREARRCRALVQELLVFSRKAAPASEPVAVGELLATTGRLLETRARTQDTRVDVDLSLADVPVRSNRTQIEQVLVNLGNNALDALSNGGSVTLRARGRGDTHIALEVEDTGPGIADEVLPRIFEPFFTTKDVGKGTGLGLSLAYEIVRQHGGHIDVRTGVGQGTCMQVVLPVEHPSAP